MNFLIEELRNNFKTLLLKPKFLILNKFSKEKYVLAFLMLSGNKRNILFLFLTKRISMNKTFLLRLDPLKWFPNFLTFAKKKSKTSLTKDLFDLQSLLGAVLLSTLITWLNGNEEFIGLLWTINLWIRFYIGFAILFQMKEIF